MHLGLRLSLVAILILAFASDSSASSLDEAGDWHSLPEDGLDQLLAHGASADEMIEYQDSEQESQTAFADQTRSTSSLPYLSEPLASLNDREERPHGRVLSESRVAAAASVMEGMTAFGLDEDLSILEDDFAVEASAEDDQFDNRHPMRHKEAEEDEDSSSSPAASEDLMNTIPTASEMPDSRSPSPVSSLTLNVLGASGDTLDGQLCLDAEEIPGFDSDELALGMTSSELLQYIQTPDPADVDQEPHPVSPVKDPNFEESSEDEWDTVPDAMTVIDDPDKQMQFILYVHAASAAVAREVVAVLAKSPEFIAFVAHKGILAAQAVPVDDIARGAKVCVKVAVPATIVAAKTIGTASLLGTFIVLKGLQLTLNAAAYGVTILVDQVNEVRNPDKDVKKTSTQTVVSTGNSQVAASLPAVARPASAEYEDNEEDDF